MSAIVAIRYLALAAPVAAVTAAGWHAVRTADPGQRRREAGAALLSFLAAAIGIAGLDALGQRLGWHSWAAVDATFRGMPVDLWLGWALLWGALPVLLRRQLPTPVALAGLLWLDLLTMPLLSPVLRLGPDWRYGELLGLTTVALPAILLGRWVAEQRRLVSRAALQMVTFGALILWLLPAIAIAAGDGAWRHLIDAPRWQISVLIQVIVLVSAPGVAAVREFVERGAGTPYPWDPPRRLVTTGPYAYLANPMQASAVTLLLVMAAATRSASLAAGAVVAAAFSGFVAAPHEADHLTQRHGEAWRAYRGEVRAWWPRWRPYRRGEALLYLARGCEICQSTRAGIERLAPDRLSLRHAELHPTTLRRIRYEDDRHAADGVAAVARALEHTHLGWAYLGWLLRLPVADRVIQLVADGLGGAPRTIRG